MLIIDTSIFTRQVLELLSDGEYRDLQKALARQPDLGDVIPNSDGLRKARWSIRGRGKRGGVRLIYDWVVRQDKILMFVIYKKNERADLTQAQTRILPKIVEEEYP